MHGEFEEMVLYHAILIKMMLGILVIGMIIPFLSKECSVMIKRTRIYMFIAHGFITTVAFSGMVAFVFAQMPFNLSMAVMIFIYIFISVIETMKYLKMLKMQYESKLCVKSMRGIAIKYTLINIAIIAGMVVWKIMEHKSAVPVS